MDVEVAEMSGEILKLIGGQALVAEEQDEVIQVRIVDFRERLVVESLREIDAENFGAEGTGHGLDVEFCCNPRASAPRPQHALLTGTFPTASTLTVTQLPGNNAWAMLAT